MAKCLGTCYAYVDIPSRHVSLHSPTVSIATCYKETRVAIKIVETSDQIVLLIRLQLNRSLTKGRPNTADI